MTEIIALVAAITAFISPILTEIVKAITARRAKAREVYFDTRFKVFNAFLQNASVYQPYPDTGALLELQKMCATAMLVSSSSTQSKIATYSNCLLKYDNSADSISSIAEAYHAVLLAMQKELKP